MKLLSTLLITLLIAGTAVAAPAPETPLVTGPNMQQVPASRILVQPTGGSIQTLGALLSNSTGDVSNATVTPTGGTSSQTMANQTAAVINVADFRAVCDGVTDDADAINAAITSVKGAAILRFPKTTTACGIRSQINLPDNGASIWIQGNGIDVTTIKALTTMTSMFFKGTLNGYVEMSNLTVDGFGLPTYNINLQGSRRTVLHDMKVANAATGGTNIIIGKSDFSSQSYEGIFRDLLVENRAPYTVLADLPLYNIAIYGTDNWITQGSYINAASANVLVATGNTNINGVHPFGFPAQFVAPYNFRISAPVQVVNSNADTSTVAGFMLDFGAKGSSFVGNRVYWAFGAAGAMGFSLPSGLLNTTITNNNVEIGGSFGTTADLAIVQNGSVDQSTIVTNNPGASYWTGANVPTGKAFQLQATDGTVTGGNARGANCSDIQGARTSQAQVCAGTNSVTIGYGNTVSAGSTQSVAIGTISTADQTNAFVLGARAHSHANQGYCQATGRRVADGDQEHCEYEMFTELTNTTSRLTVNDNIAFSTVGEIPVNSHAVFNVVGSCFDITNHTDVVDFSSSQISLTRQAGGLATMLPSPATVTRANATAGAAVATITITQDVTYPALNISATTTGSDTWACHAHVTEELTY